ncbi:MAG: N-acetyltransferase family protein [Prolixibacteraceae bacterium]
MDLEFKEIEEQDFPAIKEIYDWYIEHSTATFHTEPIRIEQLKEFIFVNHPVYQSFMIHCDHQPAGYCFLTYYKNRQAYDRTAEVTIYLKAEYCGKGIGKVAMTYLEKIAADRGLKNLIGIISGDNEGSISLFEKSGYSKCAHFKNVGEKFNKVLDVVAFQKEIG